MASKDIDLIKEMLQMQANIRDWRRGTNVG